MEKSLKLLKGVCVTINIVIGLLIGAHFTQAGTVAGTGGATEVTQMLNNTELGMQTMQDYTRNLTMAKQLYVNQMQQMQGLADPSAMQFSMNQINQINNTMGAVNRLYASTGNMKDTLQWRQNQYAASGLDWNSYVQREKDRAAMDRTRASMLTDYEQQTLNDVQRNYSDVQALQSTYENTPGTHASMMAMNGQMNMLLTMTNKARESAAIYQRDQTDRQANADAEKERVRQEGVNAIRVQDQAIDNTTQFSRSISAGKWPSAFGK